MKVNPTTLVPGRVIGTRCNQSVEGALGVAYQCTLAAGHDKTGEPHYAVESSRSVGSWQLWAAAHLPEEEHEHVWDRMDDTHIRCADPECGAIEEIELSPAPTVADDMASQFSASTGSQSRLRESEQQTERQAPPAPPPAVRPEGEHEPPTPKAEASLRHTPPYATVEIEVTELAELWPGDYVLDIYPSGLLRVLRVPHG